MARSSRKRAAPPSPTRAPASSPPRIARAVPVRPLVGPSSLLLALMASGLNGQQFRFLGYLPVAAPERARRLQALERESRAGETQCFIETPYRSSAMFDAILAACAPGTRLTVAVDLTGTTEYVQTRSDRRMARRRPATAGAQALCLPAARLAQPAAPARPEPRTPIPSRSTTVSARRPPCPMHAPPRHAPVAGSYSAPCVAHIRNSASGSKNSPGCQSSSIATCAHRLQVGDDDPAVPHRERRHRLAAEIDVETHAAAPVDERVRRTERNSSKSAAMRAVRSTFSARPSGPSAASCSRGWAP